LFRLIFAPLRIAIKLASALVGIVVFYFAFTFGQIWMTSRVHSTGPAQAILVFGTTEDNGTPSPALRARLDEALTVYRARRAPWVVVTGGRRPGDVYTEAEVSASYLEQRGVPASHVIVGSGSDTWQNVASVIARMKSANLIHVISVTDPFHEFRAMAIASAQGLQPTPSPVPSSPTIKGSLFGYYLKETLDVGVGRIIGFGNLSRWVTSSHISLPSGG